ncbi:probable glutathione S-transferase [Tanacetum coccineum]
MANEVKLYAVGGSPFVCRVKIALSIKGIKYENIEENLQNKSADLLKYNPVHKKVPVLVHNGNPINESLVIIEYLDDVWESVPLLPQDPYDKAVARFWAKFIDDKCIPALFKVFGSHGDEQAIAEACEQLQILENELKVKGTKFFGGENINIVDIAADFIAYWLGIIEEATEIKFVTKEKFPKIHEWADNFINSQAVKEILPPREHLLAFFRKRFGIGQSINLPLCYDIQYPTIGIRAHGMIRSCRFVGKRTVLQRFVRSYSAAVCLFLQRFVRYESDNDNGENILKSIDECPFKMRKFKETLVEGAEGALHIGPEQDRVFADVTPEEKKRFKADIRATDILLQGLPKDIYTLINHYSYTMTLQAH